MVSERSPQLRTRRGVLASTATGLTAVITGCGESTTQTDTETSPTTTESPTQTSPSTSTDTPTQTERGTPTPAAEDVATEFLGHFTAEEFDAAVGLFSPGFRSGLVSAVPTRVPDAFDDPARALERYWTGLTSQHGTFEEIADRTVDESESGGTATARLACSQDTQRVRLQIGGQGAITDLEFPAEYSPPEYADPDAIEERSLSVQSDGPELGGTLTLPVGPNEEVPCVVLVHGAGVSDRDVTLGPNKIFKDIAWGLATNGVAVYRYDKRTGVTDLPPEDKDIDTVFVNDAVAAAERVAEVGPVRSDRILVAGHSMGGQVAPRIAAQHGGLAGIALLDSMALSVTRLGSMGVEAIRNAEWPTERERAAYVQLFEERAGLSANEIDEGAIVGGQPGALWKSLLAYDQVDTAANLSIPTFVSHAGREVGPAELGPSRASYDRWREALPADRTRFSFYEDLNHYLQRGVEPYVPIELYAFQDNVATAVVSDLSTWVDSL